MFQIVLAVVAIAASAYSYRMAKKAAKQQNQGRAGIGVNRFGTDEPLDIIYGTRRVPPCIVYQGVKDVVEKDIPNETFYAILVWGVGPVDSISNLHFDDLPYTQFGSFGGSGNGQRIEHCLGHKDQTMPAWFHAEAPDDMKDMRFCGVAVTYVKLVMDKEFKRYPQGRPEFKSTITARSANPIEALKDYFCNADYGCSFSEQDWDDDFNATMRNLCNTVVDEQRLFECNIVLSTDAPLMDNVRDLLQTCRGYLIEGQNGLRVEIDRQKDAVMHIAESMLTSGMSTSSVNINERYNSVTIRYPDKENNYQINEITFPAQGSELHDKWLAEDNYVPLTKEETVEGIDNYKSAHQYAEVLARQSRNGMTLNVSVNFFVGEQLEEMDVVTFESKLRGWEAKPFSVREIEYTERDVKLKLVEYQDSNYLWHPKPPKPDYPNTQLPNPNQVAAPSGLSFARSESTQSVGRLSWSSPAGFIESYDVRITGNDEVIWQQNTKLNFIDVPVLLSGRYTFAVRAIGAVAASGWSVLDADITAPSAEFTVEVDAGNTYVILRPRSQSLAWGTEYEFWFDGELRGRGVAWQLEGLSPDTEYQFQVRAVNAVGQSRFQTVTATTTNDASVILDILDGKITRDILDEHLNNHFDSLDESIESIDEKLDLSVSALSEEVDAVSKAAQQESQAIRDAVSELSDEVDAVSKAAQQESQAIRDSVSALSDDVDAVSKGAQQESQAIRDSVSELSDEVDAVSKAAQQESQAIRDSVSELSDEVDQRFNDSAITIDDVRDELKSTAESVNIQLSSLSRTAQDLSKSSFSMASSMQAFMQEHERRLLEGETLVDAVVYRNPETGIIVNRAFAYTEAKYSEAQLAIDGVAATVAITAQQIERLETETGKQLIEAKAAIELNASKISQKASYSEVSEIVSGALDAITPAYSWQFNSGAEGWTGATFVEASSTIIGNQFERSNIAFNADENPVLRLRLKASQNGRLSWNGGAQNVVIKHPGDTDNFELVLVKLSVSDGWTGEVTSLRIDMDAEIDSIEIGKPSAAELQLQDVSYRLAMAEQELDAANARWSVYVTQDYWNENSLKLTDVRQEIDGFDATYKISATLKQLDDSETVEKANAAQQWIDASESTITSLVIAYNAAPGSTNDQLSEQASQLNAAEQKINALAGEISQTVFSVTELENKGDKAKGYDQLMASFQDYIRTGEYETEKISLSYAQQKINAHSDELSSHARSLLQLFAAKDEHQASLIRLDKVSSDNAKAIAESSTELKASIAEEQKARIASLEQVVTDAEQSLAQAKQLLESQMSEQNQSLISRIDEVKSTAESELAESTALLEASIAEEQKARIASLEQV
ncbi:phage tail tip protein J-related protein, partial [Vibrio sp. V40_P2S30T141]